MIEFYLKKIFLLVGTCFFQVILLDRYRPLSTQQTKSHRLNSSTFSLHEPLQFNILAFNSNNLDRIMIMIKFYSTSNHLNEQRCIARIKLASQFFCSGTGTIHWQQFKERQSFSMWHTLIKN
jgi:glycosyltransferase involved in cell wall biosynthesis